MLYYTLVYIIQEWRVGSHPRVNINPESSPYSSGSASLEKTFVLTDLIGEKLNMKISIMALNQEFNLLSKEVKMYRW